MMILIRDWVYIKLIKLKRFLLKKSYNKNNIYKRNMNYFINEKYFIFKKGTIT